MLDRHVPAPRPSRRPRCPAAVFALAFALTVAAAGCQREFWRRQADRDVGSLMGAAQNDPRWTLPGFTIRPDARSRFYDPYSLDRPPMPPDDPAAHQLMHFVDGKRGWRHWHRNGDIPTVENCAWREFLPVDEQGVLVLDLPGAMQMARLNSREYQASLEQLYLTALDVTFERFRFDAQFFGGNSTFYTADGRIRGGGNSLSVLNTNTDVQVRRLFAGGGQFVSDIANTFVWQFAGPDSSNTNTLIDFTLLQPLLRFGGRARVLERLTVSERTLLANLRQMQRFRQGFYLEIVSGTNAPQGPQRQGGFFGGAGLEGFTGVGAGGFGRVGGFGTGQGGGVVTAGAGAARAGGYIGLLQANLEIDNLAANVAGLRDSLAQLESAYDAGRIDRFQADLARQQLYNNQSQLLTRRAGYESELDQFKIQLGLPSSIEVRAADPMLDRFRLIEPRLTELQERTSTLLDELRGPAAGTVRADELGPRMQRLQHDVAAHVALVDEDFRVLEQRTPQRLQNLAYLRQQPEFAKADVDPAAYDAALFQKRQSELRDDFAKLLRALEVTTQRLSTPWKAEQPLTGEALARQLVTPLTDYSGMLLELSLIQARARLESVVLVPIELTPNLAYAVAQENRLDYMNARSSLVNTWRLIEFNANALRSDLNLIFSGDISTIGNNPVKFRDATGRLRVGVEFDAPLTRVSERNVYRQALIDYQQARRTFMLVGDTIEQGLRLTLRTIELNKLNLELRRAAVHVAINQVDLTRLRLNEPPKPGQTAQLSNTTARDLVDALSNLLLVQNDFLSVWVNYEVQRMNLDFALGTMLLDNNGLWLDPGPIHAENGYLPGSQPEELPQGHEWLAPPSQGVPDSELPPPDMAQDNPPTDAKPAVELIRWRVPAAGR